MSRIPSCFERAKANGRQLLIPYITAGDGGEEKSLQTLLALAENGADIIEIGMPFSDPMADGPTIQKACERALLVGMDLAGVLRICRQFRQVHADIPIVLMGYLNPMWRYGLQNLAKDAAAAGVDGFIVVDCPPEEADQLQRHLKQYDLDQIFLVAPTSTPERMQRIAELASGFIYYVSMKGVTGAANVDDQGLQQPLSVLRSYSQLPLAVGFGIKTAEHAVAVARHADAVVIGSALVEALHKADDVNATVQEFIQPIRHAMDEATAE